MKLAAFLTLTSLVALPSWAETSPGQTDDLSLATAITYRGQLDEGGLPADGSFDFEFSLYDAREGGTFLGSTVQYEVPVTGGSFTAELDFGRSVLDSETRWLEISVRPKAEAYFTPLVPRQFLQTKAEACTVPDDLVVDGRIGVGTQSPQRQLHLDPNPPAPQIRLEGNHGFFDVWGGGDFLVIEDGTQNRLVIQGGTGEIGIGTTSPDSRLEVAGRIHSSTGGFMFPDNTTQATKAALQAVHRTECVSYQIPYTSETSTCECLAGYIPLGGGWDSVRVETQPGGGSHSRDVGAYYNRPVDEGWEVGIYNNDDYPHEVTIFVICGKQQP